MDAKSRERADMPEGTSTILNVRTLASSHRRLSELLQPGLSVLDVGCGTGAITEGIAGRVAPDGEVVGVDVNARLIVEARDRLASGHPGADISYEVADTYALTFCDRFDIVTAARVLQWLSEPEQALHQMIKAAKPGGIVLVLDYNHERIRWEPEPPAEFKLFYAQFLQWRSDAGMHNRIADELERLFASSGLTDIQFSSQSETTTRHDPDFAEKIGIWAEVAASRGLQMVRDGYLTEDQRSQAEREYRQWIASTVESQTMYLLAVEGRKSG